MPDANGVHDRESVPARSIRVDRVGREGEPVVVVDNFSPHPERLIAEAEALTFETMGIYYPGIRAAVTPAYFEGLDGVIGPVVREVFGARDAVSVTRALYSIATTPSAELILPQRIPHIDGVEEGMIAMLHYLSHEPYGGTAFYRHRSTGFEVVNAARHPAYVKALLGDMAKHGQPEPAYIQGDTPIFDQIARYDAVFNRALIYRSNLLHCALLPNDAPLPADVHSGRLTVASFLSAR